MRPHLRATPVVSVLGASLFKPLNRQAWKQMGVPDIKMVSGLSISLKND